MQPIGIFIADSHVLFQIGLQKIFEREKDVCILGIAANVRELNHRINTARPDILLLDLDLPGMKNFDTMKQLLRKYPKMKILVVAIKEEDSLLAQAIQEGAFGYVLKSIEPSQLINMIEEMSHKSNGSDPKKLTKREAEILDLMSQGKTNKSIAQTLYISEKTVKNHVSSIFKKLEVADRTQAVIQAAKRGLVVL
ncbi:response regulator transcription factor [Candidatus Contubernalis alkaliaceticus]|uniref:response regulator transcription factor n=1 Tax=Candidatus Contubernalis alkaliaceticus TaxID=338645 RepID=UPI001F4C06B1|nr:response regulator transcription factor [Candidatus Contubernalis alkalaceticus]UNC90761.1 response regulator transcription factor [Candidatus Contubernalis alkalaceticus]